MLTARCVECECELPASSGRGRPRRYCSRGCQARAYRRRRDHGPTTAPRPAPELSGPTGADPRERLIGLAVELADSGGLDAVSMLLLAHHAAMPAHAVYRHLRNRAELLGAMAERVTAVPVPGDMGPPPDPRQRLERLAQDEWTMYREHPWLLTVLATDRPPTGPAVLAMVDRVVAAFTAAGYDPAGAFRAYLALSGYVQGMALLIRRDPVDLPYHVWWSATRDRLERTGRARRRPWLAAAGQTRLDTDLDTWFHFGLGALLDGLLVNPVR
ncbi:TetR/AcrR family transcriptional regulator C-terminal domain-containing protein [Micromonospora sp. WMMD1120]|uniref:TetR/AcrR family transcriptional regulator C-terminal domain-containing protein n=1 Tax=Micromonospora sp. WMMD1120 TaxID=3016106 RepID=UPI00241786EF|nr:TetR/AcrR family transcriptional regulator C-terminal domain-containing protein [Micromonospora sp. WMMD1120]MDG4810438.1 TetR/AcrR family transcriptional regulator C-terminal domain-containing protein [Micromonospora sp. WMMD1120]